METQGHERLMPMKPLIYKHWLGCWQPIKGGTYGPMPANCRLHTPRRISVLCLRQGVHLAHAHKYVVSLLCICVRDVCQYVMFTFCMYHINILRSL